MLTYFGLVTVVDRGIVVMIGSFEGGIAIEGSPLYSTKEQEKELTKLEVVPLYS